MGVRGYPRCKVQQILCFELNLSNFCVSHEKCTSVVRINALFYSTI